MWSFSDDFAETVCGNSSLQYSTWSIKPELEVTQEEIERACRNANILDFVNSLPELVLTVCVIQSADVIVKL
jgi:hypothetical protein